MRNEQRIRKMIEQLRSIQGDHQFQAQVYPISDVISALSWVLGENDKIELGSCSCRWPDFKERVANEK